MHRLLPTFGLLYSFLVPQGPHSLLFRESFSNENETLDIFYDVNPMGALRGKNDPVHFTGYLVKKNGQRLVEGWQTIQAGSKSFVFTDQSRPFTASQLPSAIEF